LLTNGVRTYGAENVNGGAIRGLTRIASSLWSSQFSSG
jgi:hypothetical protein